MALTNTPQQDYLALVNEFRPAPSSGVANIVPFSQILSFASLLTTQSTTQTGPITFTVGNGAVRGAECVSRIVANETTEPVFSAPLKMSANSGRWDNRVGALNVIHVYFDGVDYWVHIWQEANQVIVPPLVTFPLADRTSIVQTGTDEDPIYSAVAGAAIWEARMLANLKLPAGQDGWVGATHVNIANAFALGFRTTYGVGTWAALTYGMYIGNGSSYFTTASLNTGVVPQAQDRFRVRRAGSTILGERAAIGTNTWLPVATLGTYSGDLFIQCNLTYPGVPSARQIIGAGLVSV